MRIEIQLTNEPIPACLPPPRLALGAWVEFRGVVRGEEGGRLIAALEYEAYSPMAEREMHRLLTELAADYPCLSARVIHRLGCVPVGETALYLGIAGRHRTEAFALLARFMDRLKQDVPIWKRRAIPDFSVYELAAPAAAPGTDTGAPGRGGPASAAEVLSLLPRLCSPLEPEPVPLAEAAGRVLRQAVCAPEDQPPFDRSAVDGYAVRLDDPGPGFRVVGEIRAGACPSLAVAPGEAVRISTGAALPHAGLQVLMKEEVEIAGDSVRAARRNGERHIRFRGEDAHAGQELVRPGTVLSPGALGLLASLGCARPLVARLPRVLHVATGNEIVPLDQPPAPGQIRDSNSTLVRAFLGRWGIVPEQRRAGEDKAQVQAALDRSLAALDLLLISGGASVGEHDFTLALLEEAGFSVHVRRTAARPGKPLIVARRGGTLAFGLPGNPLAHFVCLHLYVRAALAAWAGLAAAPAFQWGRLAEELPAGGGSGETFWPAQWELRQGAAVLTPLPWRSSGDLTALSAANALLRVPAGARAGGCGSPVEFLTTERIG